MTPAVILLTKGAGGEAEADENTRATRGLPIIDERNAHIGTAHADRRKTAPEADTYTTLVECITKMFDSRILSHVIPRYTGHVKTIHLI